MAENDYIVAESTFVDEIDFIETNAEEIVNRLIERFEEYTGEILYPGDERRIFLQGFAYVLADTENHINETGRGNLLKYAQGLEIDALGDLFSNPRLQGNYAKTTLEIKISQAQGTDLVIPKGTRVTPDGVRFFATDTALIFPSNTIDLKQTVSATATEVGEEHNGFIEGQINKLVESIEYVESVKNTTESAGGSNIESDERYKERLRLSPFNYSVAGPATAYEAIVKSVSPDIESVYVHSPSAGVVEIVFTKTGGVVPNLEDPLINQILEACSDKNKRPLTDNVKVVPATAKTTNIVVDYYVANGDVSVLEDVMASVEDYKVWQTSKVGRAIVPDELIARMKEAGAARIVVTSPTYQALNSVEIAQIGETKVTYKGSINI